MDKLERIYVGLLVGAILYLTIRILTTWSL